MNEGTGGVMGNTPFGDLTVYREYMPTRDSIEYTIYFRLPEEGKCRIDIYGSVLTWDRIENDPEGPGIENYIYDTMTKLIAQGKYRSASTHLGANSNGTDDYKAHRID